MTEQQSMQKAIELTLDELNHIKNYFADLKQLIDGDFALNPEAVKRAITSAFNAADEVIVAIRKGTR
jgi:hypothetical protein